MERITTSVFAGAFYLVVAFRFLTAPGMIAEGVVLLFAGLFFILKSGTVTAKIRLQGIRIAIALLFLGLSVMLGFLSLQQTVRLQQEKPSADLLSVPH